MPHTPLLGIVAINNSPEAYQISLRNADATLCSHVEVLSPNRRVKNRMENRLGNDDKLFAFFFI